MKTQQWVKAAGVFLCLSMLVACEHTVQGMKQDWNANAQAVDREVYKNSHHKKTVKQQQNNGSSSIQSQSTSSQ